MTEKRGTTFNQYTYHSENQLLILYCEEQFILLIIEQGSFVQVRMDHPNILYLTIYWLLAGSKVRCDYPNLKKGIVLFK